MYSALTEEEKKFIAGGPVEDIKRAVLVGVRGYRGIIAQMYRDDSVFHANAVGALGDRKLARTYSADGHLLRGMMMGAIPTGDFDFIEFLYDENPKVFNKKIKSLIIQEAATRGNYFIFRKVLGSDPTVLDNMKSFTPIAKGLNECKEPRIFHYLINEGLMKRETVLGFVEDEKTRKLIGTMKMKYPRFVNDELTREFVDTILYGETKQLDAFISRCSIVDLESLLKLAIEISSARLVKYIMKRGEFYGDGWLFLAVDANETDDGIDILECIVEAGLDRRRRISVAMNRAVFTDKKVFVGVLSKMGTSE